MMMAELVQGQASVAQAGMKDGFTDPFHRARQVRDASDRVFDARVCVFASARLDWARLAC